ncbi:MAG: phosphoglycerate kinase [Patescibacteria group bacterium]|jgi:phosphoglycerate kinase
MHLRTWTSSDITLGTRVFLRIDGNVPVVRGQAKDGAYGRLQQTIPEIVKLRAHGARIILATHLGDPGGKVDDQLSVVPIARLLAEKLGKPVRVLSGIVGQAVEREVLGADAGEILMLENLRFDPGEEENSVAFAKSLARLADVYVNNAFGVCHRAHASVDAITRELPSFAGELVVREVRTLEKQHSHPYVVVLGGAKLATKLPLVEHLAEPADVVLVGGALCLPLLHALDRPLPEKVKKDMKVEDVKAAESLLRRYMEKIILPEDLHIEGASRVIDIGPKTTELYALKIAGAMSVLWNGPMGIIEEPGARAGTKAVAKAIGDALPKTAIVGGGDTVEFLESLDLLKGFTHVSTGGGAMLALLSGEKLPGLEALQA